MTKLLRPGSGTAMLVFALLLSVSTSRSAFADTPKKNPTLEAIKKDKDDLKGARKDLRDALKAGDAGAAQEAKDDLKKGKEELKQDREENRKAQAETLKKKYGDDLDKPGVKEELRKHHRRMARLRRIGQLAKVEQKDGIQKRAEAAIVKEKKRHDEAMGKLTKAGAK